MMHKANKAVRDWWNGETRVYDDPNFIGVYTARHWTSDWAHTLWEFYLRHWQWLWGIAVAIALALFATG